MGPAYAHRKHAGNRQDYAEVKYFALPGGAGDSSTESIRDELSSAKLKKQTIASQSEVFYHFASVIRSSH